VVNVVDLMKLQPPLEHPHGLSDEKFDALFTKDKPIIFAFHAYPWLIHRLTYRRANHHNLHVRGYKEEGTITTPFDMDGVSPITQPAVKPGESFTYAFTATDHAEMGMYHAHDHGQVAVVNGMFAVFQVGDLPLPRGSNIDNMPVPADMVVSQELALVTNDAGVIGLTLNGKSYPATAPIVANPGDWVLMHYYNEGLMAHPMHLHHVAQLVVAKDGFPLAQPYYADTINIAPGERYSVLVHPTDNDIGVWAWHCHILNHAENDDGLFGMVTALIVNDPSKPKA
jgi:FtsP/CotA-like multicopper oxidase with cupredoxin domain